MPPASDTLDATGLTIDRNAHAIRMNRRLRADPRQVFAAWTEPKQVACWWDAAGEPLARCEIDLRVGGQFIFVTRGHPEMPFAGTYREISAPDRIEFDAMGSVGRVSLSEAEAGTDMVVEIVCASAEQLDQFIAMGVDKGTSQTLDNLVRHLD
jgi:uncharacterized protein YndB with AHSA1/START domain